jgi:hypothetical protein
MTQIITNQFVKFVLSVGDKQIPHGMPAKQRHFREFCEFREQ